MVAKLMKHELFSIMRIVIIPLAVMILLATVCRITLIGASESSVIWVLVLFYIFACLATLCICGFIGVSRFYKTFFTGEGYMTMSLPVSADQLILAELFSSIIALLFGLTACLLSSCIFLIGAGEAVKATVADAFDLYGGFLGTAFKDNPLLCVEFIILLILSIPAAFLELFFVMSIGQLFTVKNRKGIAFALYIGIAFAWSIFSPIIWDPMLDMAKDVSVHLYIWIKIICIAAIDAVCYLVVRYILKNKVNLVA